jgi:integrase
MMPQYIIEIIFIFTMIILCFGILQNYGENPSNILVSFGVVAIAIYRVVPQIYKNQIYINYISIYTKNLEELFKVYEEYLSYDYPKEDNKARLPFKNQISIRNLFYSYDKVSNVLKNINVDIKKGEFIGVVGLSGSGKSTFVDCLLGLLKYQGQICVDDEIMDIFRTRFEEQNKQRKMAGDLWKEPFPNLVFENEFGTNLSHATIRKHFKKAVAEIGLPEERFHNMRHNYTVAALESGDDVNTVQENLGHATPNFTLKVYDHVTATRRIESAKRMNDRIKMLKERMV